MKHTRSFQTIVITKRKIMLLCIGLAATVCMIYIIFILCNSAEPAIAMDEQLYSEIINGELPAPDNKPNAKKIISSILGFDITQPSTILQGHSSIFVPKPHTEQNIDTQPKMDEKSEIKIEDIKISKGLAINNKTSYEVDASALASQKLPFVINTDEPQILIVHTHTTESYTPADSQSYTSSGSDRNTDLSKNIVAVGDAVCNILNQNGIKTIHDTTVHDYPSYNGAYGRSMATVKNNLNKYPSVKIVLDIHRDGLVREDGTKLKVSTDIDGVKTAQVMLVVGTNASGLLHDGWRSNLSFACKLQNEANNMYPSLMRPIDLREERFNQHLTAGSLILEIGSNGNTLEEAVRGGEDIAQVISKVLKNNS